MRFSSVRFRHTSALLCLALGAAVLAPTTSWAGAPVSPSITSPPDGSTVNASPLAVTAGSTAASVEFAVGAGPADSDLVAVTGGSATGSLEVYGLDGNVTVTAADCAPGPVCSAPGDSIQVDVQLDAPTITAPKPRSYVRNSVDVKATAPGGTVRYSLDGDPVGGSPVGDPFDKRVSLKGELDGRHVIKVQQCNNAGDVCNGESDALTVFKDTKPPRWSNVSASNKTVFPVKDHYKDSTRLSARLSENVVNASIEIRKAGGPVVRTLKLGRESSGRVSANWNGRKANGDMVHRGRYTYRFIGKDKSGLTGRSDAKDLQVSDKKLVKKNVTKTVGALQSGLGDSSGDCSRVVAMRYLQGYGRNWRGGLQWQSNWRRNCTGAKSVALSGHVVGTDNAVRYGTFQVSAYGGAALTRGGPAKILYVKKNETWGARQGLKSPLGWHNGDRVPMDPYLIGKGKLVWAVATVNGNFYDVKSFRISYTVWVLR